jgi:hypothetical protein
MRKTNVSEWLFLIVTASLVLAASLFAVTADGATASLSLVYSPVNNPGSLIQASDGNFYGVATGTNFYYPSTVFKVTPDGHFTTLLTAPYNPNGTVHYADGNGYSSLVEGHDGLLYVVASYGGTPGGAVASPGAIVRIDKSGGSFKVMHYGCSAPNCSDGGAPTTLALASDGNFYGAMGTGASSTCYIGCGTIFRLKTDGTYTVLYSPVQGEIIATSFIDKQASDGNFYGGCYGLTGGNPNGVCRITTSGQVTPFFQYADGSSGRWPGSLNLGSDGFLYGVDLGGPSDTGFQVVFQLSTSGSYKELRQTEGCTPKTGCSTVMQASDGNLWIADQRASSVYSITPTGTLLQTVNFYGSPEGYRPQFVIQASSGILYGTTHGPSGTVFSINADLAPPQ